MNILVLSWRGPGHPSAGGAEISTHEHLKGWVKKGHKVTLFTSYFRGGKKREIIDGVKVIRAGRQLIGVQIEAFWWYLFAGKQKFDLVVDQFHGLPFFTPLYVRVKRMAFIHEVTKEIWKYNTLPKPLNLIPSFLGPVLEPLIFKALYKNMPFMTVSNSTKDDLIAWGVKEQSIQVIHNGVILSKLRNFPVKEKKKTAIFLGSIAKDKGIEDALRIFSELDKTDSDWQFWVVGKSDPAYLQFLKRLAKNLGIFNKVSFKGYVSEKEKFSYLAKAHILINPSIREGWGLVVIEAASVGTPTVGYNVPGLRDSIKNGETGLLSEPKVKSCAEAVNSLMEDKVRYQKFQKNCLKWSSELSWEKSSTESLKLIGKIVRD